MASTTKSDESTPIDEEKLIDAVREQPSLWNKVHPDYKNSKSKERSWLFVSDKVKLPGETMSLYVHKHALL